MRRPSKIRNMSRGGSIPRCCTCPPLARRRVKCLNLSISQPTQSVYASDPHYSPSVPDAGHSPERNTMISALDVMVWYMSPSRKYSRVYSSCPNSKPRSVMERTASGTPRLKDAKIAANELNRQVLPQRRPGHCEWSRTAVQDACYELWVKTEYLSSHDGLCPRYSCGTPSHAPLQSQIICLPHSRTAVIYLRPLFLCPP
jgi:hypothetical protein